MIQIGKSTVLAEPLGLGTNKSADTTCFRISMTKWAAMWSKPRSIMALT